MADAANEQLFDDVTFTIVPSTELDDTQKQLLIDTLTSQGATYAPYKSTGLPGFPFNSEGLTHIIATHVEFPDYRDSIQQGISTVKPTWVSDSLAKKRLVTARQYSPDPTQFFHDVIVTCGTLPECDENAIIAGVIALGGQYSVPLTKIVTHIVTTDMNNEKCSIVQERGLPVKIVLPHWFDDCLRLGKKINEQPYELPHPEILQSDASQPILPRSAPGLEGASSSKPDSHNHSAMDVSPSKGRKSLTVFHQKSVYLGKDLEINSHLKATLATLIENAGGSPAESVSTSDIYVGQFRESDEFVDAFVEEKTIANLSWLYYVLNNNQWSDPLAKLLHYPVPKHGIPGFEDLRISVSNYAGDARTYVQNLVQECGAQFTKTMKQDNTHLVTAHTQSEKCQAATEWNINMVNHLWVEESYARCAVQTLTNPRYTHFPSKTNLGEVCGQTTIDSKRIEQVFVLPRLAEREKKPLARRLFEVKEDDAPKDLTGTPDVASSARRAATATPHIDGKENLSPFAGSGGRASKLKATQALHDAADDIAQFQKEMKRKGGVVHGGRRPDDLPANKSRGTKRSSDTYEEPGDEADLSFGSTQKVDKPAAKKPKVDTKSSDTLPPITIRLMVTGDDRWVNNTKKESADKIALRKLGVQLLQDPGKADVVVASSILRTRKFVVAIANAPKVYDISYLDTALDESELMDDPPLLIDEAAEKQYDFKLSEALDRAKANKHKLFKDWNIYVSDHLNGGFSTYEEILKANGGSALLYKAKRGVTLHGRQNDDNDDDSEAVYLVAGDGAADKALWKSFRELAKTSGLQARIMSADWLLNAALTQQIRFKTAWEWPE